MNTLQDKIKVENMVSSNGNTIPNQFEITINGDRYFQSYDSVIVKIDASGQVLLDEYYWDYSNTTGKYRNLFLGEDKQTTKSKIKNGTYKLINLN